MTGPRTARWAALGTTASVVVCDGRALGRARAAVQAQLAAIDAACSRFRQDSELTRLNAAAGAPVAVSALLFEAVLVALRAAELTGGAVDPTIGEALVLAGYDRDFAAGPVEPSRRLAVARVPGWKAVRVDRRTRSVALPRGVRLDLGATAKALAADHAAAAAAAAAPGSGVMVNLGGDLAVAGPPPDGGWRVRVSDDHRAPADAPGQSLTIGAGALATSSTTVRRWGRTAHHIIDPRTGAPAVSRWRTVSVAAACCVDANIASTAAIVMGDDAPAWLASRELPARLVDGDGVVRTVAGWPAEVLAA
ncbi:MAG TPA: FAD:protein FMN transferase [Solirubrobacteraceae bacterium]|nr:FAD:protein FMN transferase [Solirubrobacteraceae bacterium]